MTKDTRLSIRISPELKAELEALTKVFEYSSLTELVIEGLERYAHRLKKEVNKMEKR